MIITNRAQRRTQTFDIKCIVNPLNKNTYQAHEYYTSIQIPKHAGGKKGAKKEVITVKVRCPHRKVQSNWFKKVHIVRNFRNLMNERSLWEKLNLGQVQSVTNRNMSWKLYHSQQQ